MIHNKKSFKAIIFILILINSIYFCILLSRTTGVKSIIGTGYAIAADENDGGSEDSSGKKKNRSGDQEEGGKKGGSEPTKEELEAKNAEKARIMLDGLEAKRLQLKEQEELIKNEQKKLKTLKKELEEKIANLEKIHSQINISLEKLNRKKSEKELAKEAAEEKKIKKLVKVYSSMKPKNAGLIINSMDIVVAEKIIRNMKGDAAGKILSFVESSRAAQISERIASDIGREQE